MSLFRDLTYLEHIKDSIEKIRSYTQSLSEEDFQESTLVQDAVVRQLEIIGEATKRVSGEIKQEYPEVPWKDMAGMRDVMIPSRSRILFGNSSISLSASRTPTTFPSSSFPISSLPPSALANPHIHLRYSSRHLLFHSMPCDSFI
mgnify:CR=1 FL=1